MLKNKILIISLLLAALLCGCSKQEAEHVDTATPQPTVEVMPEPTPDQSLVGKLRISEIMVKNRATIMDDTGLFSDWIELENGSSDTVDLAGWSLSDKANSTGFSMPSLLLEPGQRLLIFASGASGAGEALHVDFSLSPGEIVSLYTPDGLLSSQCEAPELESDIAWALTEDGSYTATPWATPGYANNREGYEQFSKNTSLGDGLIINEVMVANQSYQNQRNVGTKDWVELKNVSDAPIELSEYWLSDKDDNYLLWQLPQRTLQPGETVLFYCSGDESNSVDGWTHTNFSLDANRDQLFLSKSDVIVDYINLHDVPVDGSCGRGEDGVISYYTSPTPDHENSEGYRIVSEKPENHEPDGVFDGVDHVSVELSAEGSIYYTTDGSIPTENSSLYTGAISLSKTTVIRAVAIEEGAAPSRVLTLNYIINEGHSLPVLSLAVDENTQFLGMYRSGIKEMELPGSLSLYEDGLCFTQACGVKMAGSGSLELPKKSMAIMFRDKYGDGDLYYDVFDTGIEHYASLHLRVGEAYPNTLVMSDFFQDLCLDMEGSALTQHSKYCVLYVNGQYYGIFCLKEKFSEQYYASLKEVDKDSVTVLKYPVELSSEFHTDVINFCQNNDLSLDENYEYLCSVMDVDSFIDWLIVEGISGNGDIGGNLRLFKSEENGGKWSFALYDLDWAFNDPSRLFYNLMNGTYYHSGQCAAILGALADNEDFVDRLLTRYAEVYDTVLSNESMIAKIDAYEELLEPEIARERERWGSSVEIWHMRLQEMRDFITNYDVQNRGVKNLFSMLGFSEALRVKYFGW